MSGNEARKIVPVILAGGSGSRLWPLSRELYPKQFLNIDHELSLLQQTLSRIEILEAQPPILVCNEEHRFLVAEQCRAIGIQPAAILLEPDGRNTAPATALAAFIAEQQYKDSILIVLPSDHVVTDVQALKRALHCAADRTEQNRLIAFGIIPDSASTDYGYIETAAPVESAVGAQQIVNFHEKPPAELARTYLESGRHFWNSGMFVFRASTFLSELREIEPAMHRAIAAASSGCRQDGDFTRPGPEFLESRSASIDYAVMERTSNAEVIPIAIGWSDLGSWESLAAYTHSSENGNAIFGDVVDDGSENSLLLSEHRLLTTIGLKDTIVVETKDAVLVAARAKTTSVRALVSKLKELGREEVTSHRKVYRPWGSYERLDSGPEYQVKLIIVNSGASLSRQLHQYRSEHWVVVHGTASVERGDETYILSQNESTYIPKNSVHRLSNREQSSLVIVEIQVGTYLEEDDIERITDDYGRVSSD